MNCKFRWIYGKLGPLWWNSLKMFFASRIGDVFALCIGAFIVPALLKSDDLGAVLPVMKLAAVLVIPLNIILMGALKYINLYASDDQWGKIKRLTLGLFRFSAIYSVLLIVFVVSFQTRILVYLKIENITLMWLIAATAVLSFWIPTTYTLACSLKRFNTVIANKIVGPFVRLIATIALLGPLQIAGYLWAHILASTAIVGVYLVSVKKAFSRDVKAEEYKEDLPKIRTYVIRVAPYFILMTLYEFYVLSKIRHVYSNQISAEFYLAFTLGNIVLWVAPAMIPFLYPLVSERFEQGKETGKMHIQSLVVTSVIGFGITAFFLLFGETIVSLVPPWRPYQASAGLIWIWGAITCSKVVLQTHVTHEQAVNRFCHYVYYIPITLAELAAIAWITRTGADLSLSHLLRMILVFRTAVMILVFLEAYAYYAKRKGASRN